MSLECKLCGRSFPSHLVQPLMHDGEYTNCCPLCADDIMGGLRGEISTSLLEEAKEYMKGKGDAKI